MLLAISGVALAAAGRRLVAFLLQACEATNTGPLPPAPEPRALYRALEKATR